VANKTVNLAILAIEGIRALSSDFD